jgi:predicted RNase H-like HicB family nuclease
MEKESAMRAANRVPADGSRATSTYTAVLTPGEDGFVCAQIAEVPEAISQGRTRREAKANVREALELALEWRRDEEEPLPERAQVTLTT